MASFTKPKKILWAIDAFQGSPAAFRNVTATVARFARFFGAKVELVYAYHVPKLYMAPEAFIEFERPYLTQARKNLESIAKDLKGVDCQVTVLTDTGKNQKQDELNLILKYARKKGFDWISVATHGRNAVLNLFMGSFAESLLLQSKIPLLIISPHQKKVSSKPLRTILFPTDFSPKSKKIFDSLVPIAKQRGLELHLTHGLINSYIPLTLSDAPLMGAAISIQTDVFQESLARQRRRLHDWVGACKAQGVKAAGETYSSVGAVSDVIHDSAEKNRVDLIVMASQAGKPAHKGMGSITKKVIRKSMVPVLALKY